MALITDTVLIVCIALGSESQWIDSLLLHVRRCRHFTSSAYYKLINTGIDSIIWNSAWRVVWIMAYVV